MHSLFIKDKRFYYNVAKIAIPVALQGLITTGVNIMDTVMVGAVGQTQLSAVSLANQFINIFHIFCMGKIYLYIIVLNKFLIHGKCNYHIYIFFNITIMICTKILATMPRINNNNRRLICIYLTYSIQKSR